MKWIAECLCIFVCSKYLFYCLFSLSWHHLVVMFLRGRAALRCFRFRHHHAPTWFFNSFPVFQIKMSVLKFVFYLVNQGRQWDNCQVFELTKKQESLWLRIITIICTTRAAQVFAILWGENLINSPFLLLVKYCISHFKIYALFFWKLIWQIETINTEQNGYHVPTPFQATFTISNSLSLPRSLSLEADLGLCDCYANAIKTLQKGSSSADAKCSSNQPILKKLSKSYLYLWLENPFTCVVLDMKELRGVQASMRSRHKINLLSAP